jgi:hypothetical protein
MPPTALLIAPLRRGFFFAAGGLVSRGRGAEVLRPQGFRPDGRVMPQRLTDAMLYRRPEKAWRNLASTRLLSRQGGN